MFPLEFRARPADPEAVARPPGPETLGADPDVVGVADGFATPSEANRKNTPMPRSGAPSGLQRYWSKLVDAPCSPPVERLVRTSRDGRSAPGTASGADRIGQAGKRVDPCPCELEGSCPSESAPVAPHAPRSWWPTSRRA